MLKVGVGASRDAIKVKKDLGIVMGGVMNCEDVVDRKEMPIHSGGKSLHDLCGTLLGKWLKKDQYLRTGNWEKVPLTLQQVEYAAIDAYASLLVYQSLQKLPDRTIVKKQNVTSPTRSLAYTAAMKLTPSECTEITLQSKESLVNLPPSKHSCWDMWHLQGWNIDQISDAKGIKVNTVRGQ